VSAPVWAAVAVRADVADAPDEAPNAGTPAAMQISAAAVSAAAISPAVVSAAVVSAAVVSAGRASRGDEFISGAPSPQAVP
jgi:hypothetical protein